MKGERTAYGTEHPDPGHLRGSAAGLFTPEPLRTPAVPDERGNQHRLCGGHVPDKQHLHVYHAEYLPAPFPGPGAFPADLPHASSPEPGTDAAQLRHPGLFLWNRADADADRAEY